MILLLGTRNKGKQRELKELLTGLDGVELLTFSECPFTEVEETGATCEENALLKARTIGEEIGRAVLADDTGLEVAALGGEPGVYSARYAGIPPDHTRNNVLLLSKLHGIDDRQARFVMVAALHLPDGREFICKGALCGRITHRPIGEGGFGYDPLFIPNGSSRTLAEMTLAEKNAISHRYRAIAEIKQILRMLAA